jgi:DNA-binding HxlR family transcriptional regulator
MSRLDGRWKIVILYYIGANLNRFSILKKKIPYITDKMLSSQLRELEQDDLIERKIFPEIPPKVEYYLTSNGQRLLPILDQLHDWGKMLSEISEKQVHAHPSQLVI